MRTWGRIWGAVSSGQSIGIVSAGGIPILPSGTPSGQQPPIGTPTPIWVEVTTDASGNNDMVYFVTLCQCLLLQPNEDPSFANYGVDAINAVQTGVPPDYWVAQTQSNFAQYFAQLTIIKATDNNGNPVYNITVLFHNGVELQASVPIPV